MSFIIIFGKATNGDYSAPQAQAGFKGPEGQRSKVKTQKGRKGGIIPLPGDSTNKKQKGEDRRDYPPTTNSTNNKRQKGRRGGIIHLPLIAGFATVRSGVSRGAAGRTAPPNACYKK